MSHDSITGRIVVAMSGGVDSSVAAMLLKQQGYEPVGVSMQVWDYRKNGGCDSRATCCSPDDFTDARKVAAKIGIPYYVFDFEESFREKVIDKFIDTYKRGLTPNPCVDCNNKVKFRELRDRASGFGCKAVATGHFARVEKRESGYHLLRGCDRAKDQSYFLYGVQPEELANTLFPVGEMNKTEVRQLAEEAGLPTASKPESQDICFVAGGLRDFLKRHTDNMRSGLIVTTEGVPLAEHDGISNFTVGQRKGIGVGGRQQPLYVLEIDPDDNRVIVGAKEDLEQRDFKVGEINWVNPDLRQKSSTAQPFTFEAIAQLRHRHAGVPVAVSVLASGEVSASFIDSWSTVSPGQAAVFYDQENREVLGGGRLLPQSRYSREATQ